MHDWALVVPCVPSTQRLWLRTGYAAGLPCPQQLHNSEVGPRVPEAGLEAASHVAAVRPPQSTLGSSKENQDHQET